MWWMSYCLVNLGTFFSKAWRFEQFLGNDPWSCCFIQPWTDDCCLQASVFPLARDLRFDRKMITVVPRAWERVNSVDSGTGRNRAGDFCSKAVLFFCNEDLISWGCDLVKCSVDGIQLLKWFSLRSEVRRLRRHDQCFCLMRLIWLSDKGPTIGRWGKQCHPS